MKTTAVLVTVLAATALAAQSQSQSPAQSSSPQAGTPSSGRPPVQTKTREEYKAYQAAVASGQNADAMEKAADDFATKFPDSEVRVLLYRAAMSSYQNRRQPAKNDGHGTKGFGYR